MNDRLLTAAGALLALILVAGMFIQPAEDPGVTRPTSVESGGNGYQGLHDWLIAAGVPVHSLRLRFDALHREPTLAGGGHLLLTTPPFSKPARSDELDALLDWVAAGNTLVIAAALNDTPDWSDIADGEGFLGMLETLTGTRFEAAQDSAGAGLVVGELNDSMDVVFLGEAYSNHPLAEDMKEAIARTDGIASIWVPVDQAPGVPFLQEASSGLAAGWTRTEGNGHLITLTAGSLFSNRVIGRADNRTLLANLIHWHLGPDGVVVIDDLHQGLSEIYDPEAFYSDSRLGYTLLFLLGLWFTYMVGSNHRLLPAQSFQSVPSQGDLIRSLGGFLARKLPESGENGAASLVFDNWFQTLAARVGSNDQAAVWRYLAASPLVNQRALTEVQGLHGRYEAGARVDVRRLHNLIRDITEALG